MFLFRLFLLHIPLLTLSFFSTPVLGQTTTQGYFTEWEVDGEECNKISGSIQQEERPYKYVCLTPQGEKVDLPVKPQGVSIYPSEIPGGETLSPTQIINEDGSKKVVIEREYPNLDVENSETRRALIGQMADLYKESLRRDDTYERAVGDFKAMVEGYERLVPNGGVEELQQSGIQPQMGVYIDPNQPEQLEQIQP